MARVLEDHGVDVEIARGEEDLLGEGVDAGTAVVVTNPDQLGRSTLSGCVEHGREAGAIVVVGDGAVRRRAVRHRGRPRSADGRRRADCDEPLARGLVVRTHDGGGLDAEGCFGSDGTSVLVRRDAVWLMTAPTSFTNERVLESDNGALALRLLGQQDRLVWYVADAADTAASDGVGLSELLPPWAGPGALPAVSRACSGSCSGADAGWVRWSPSRCRWSYARPSRPRAAAGSTAAPATAGTPPRSWSTLHDDGSSRR